MEQLLCHIAGDFWLQNDWIAMNKNRRSIPCLVHVLIYTSMFVLIGASFKALLVIGITHFFLDRFHTPLKRMIWLKNHLKPELKYPPFSWCNTTGWFDDSPYNTFTKWDGINPKYKANRRLFPVTIWLYIIHDNFLHLLINYLALQYL